MTPGCVATSGCPIWMKRAGKEESWEEERECRHCYRGTMETGHKSAGSSLAGAEMVGGREQLQG